METNNKTCPVCSDKMSSSDIFCKKCGWMRILLPEVIPDALQKQEEERLKIAKEAYAFKIASERDGINLENLKNSLAQKDSELQEQKTRLENMKAELDAANDKLAKDEQHIRKLQSGLDKAKAAVQQTQATVVHAEVKGFVMLKNLATDEEATVAILEGVNIYGSKEDSGLYHKIKLDPIKFVFEPEQFSIDTTRAKGWVLRDLSNGSIQTKAGYVPENGVYINNALGRVLINDIIEIRIVKL